MDQTLTYRGRPITPADLAGIRARIAEQPTISRRALSLALCTAWQWTQPNGMPCDAVCRGLLLWLHRAGHIVLPPARWVTGKPWRPRTSAPPVLVDTSPQAKAKGMTTIALTGRDGGPIGAEAEIHINVGEASTPRVQEVHRTILHAMCSLVDQSLKP